MRASPVIGEDGRETTNGVPRDRFAAGRPALGTDDPALEESEGSTWLLALTAAGPRSVATTIAVDRSFSG
jgi:hypothetical protein